MYSRALSCSVSSFVGVSAWSDFGVLDEDVVNFGSKSDNATAIDQILSKKRKKKKTWIAPGVLRMSNKII